MRTCYKCDVETDEPMEVFTYMGGIHWLCHECASDVKLLVDNEYIISPK